jgi:hypothetical protein
MSPSKGLYLHRKTAQKHKGKHPCPGRDSNLRSQLLSGQVRFRQHGIISNISRYYEHSKKYKDFCSVNGFSTVECFVAIYEVVTAVRLIMFFRVVTTSGLVCIYQRFGEMWCLLFSETSRSARIGRCESLGHAIPKIFISGLQLSIAVQDAQPVRSVC